MISTIRRILSLAILIISLAPLASIYMFIFSLGIYRMDPLNPVLLEDQQADPSIIHTKRNENNHHHSITPPSLAEILQNPNSTLEELWEALVLERWGFSVLDDTRFRPKPPPSTRHETNQKNSNEDKPPPIAFQRRRQQRQDPFRLTFIPNQLSPQSRHDDDNYHPDSYSWNSQYDGQWALSIHIKIMVPWLVSFILGVVVPTCLSIWSFVRQRRLVKYKQERKQKQLQRTVRLLRNNFTKQLVETDRVPDTGTQSDTSSNDEESEDEIPQSWRLPLPGQSLSSVASFTDSSREGPDSPSSQDTEEDTSPLRTVAGTCAICLNHYQTGDTVVWAPNPNCVHVFHQDCLLEWFTRKSKDPAKKRANAQDCPCCRQSFLAKAQS